MQEEEAFHKSQIIKNKPLRLKKKELEKFIIPDVLPPIPAPPPLEAKINPPMEDVNPPPQMEGQNPFGVIPSPPPEELAEIVPQIIDQMAVDGDRPVQLFLKEGQELAEKAFVQAQNKEELFEEAEKKLKEEIVKGNIPIEKREGEIIELAQDEKGLPILLSTFIQITENLDMRTIEDQAQYYTLEKMMKDGFTSKDMMTLAKQRLTAKHNLLENQGKKTRHKLLKTKSYSLEDLDKMRAYAKKTYANPKRKAEPYFGIYS